MKTETQVALPDSAEPTAKSNPLSIPLWLLAAVAAFLFYGCYYADRAGGEFNELVFGPYHSTNELAEYIEVDPVVLWAKRGAVVFNANCAACHGANGLGIPGDKPPLAGSDWVNGVGPDRVIRIILQGLKGPITVSGVEYNNNMTPWKDSLTDEQIAQVTTFIRRAWKNSGSAVTTEQVTAIRKATAARGDEQWTAADLLKLPHGEEPK